MIKTWQEREFEAHGYIAFSPASNVVYMKAEINDLRAELAEVRNQKPFGWIMAESLDDFKRGNIVEVSRGRETSDDVSLYLAAGVEAERTASVELEKMNEENGSLRRYIKCLEFEVKRLYEDYGAKEKSE